MSNTKEKSIHIGINYPGTDAELNGCVGDAIKLLALSVDLQIEDIVLAVDVDVDDPDILEKNTSRDARDAFWQNKTDIDLMVPTRTNILRAISNTVSDNSISSLFLTYSGHGTRGRQDYANSEETDLRDEYICTLGKNGIYKGSYASFISDDDLFNTINKAAESRTSPIVITYIFDCCNSGTVFDLEHRFYKIDNRVRFETEPSTTKRVLSPNVTISGWSGCQDAQSSYETYNAINRIVEGVCTRSIVKVIREMVIDSKEKPSQFALHCRAVDYMMSIDTFNDDKIDISSSFQVLNHSSSINIGMANDDQIIVSQKFVPGQASDVSVATKDLVVKHPRSDYPYFDITDSAPDNGADDGSEDEGSEEGGEESNNASNTGSQNKVKQLLEKWCVII